LKYYLRTFVKKAQLNVNDEGELFATKIVFSDGATFRQSGYVNRHGVRIWGVGGKSNLYSSPSIVRAIKSRRMKWMGHVEHMVECRGVYRVWKGNRLEDPVLDGRIILRWIFR
jgi:hypothetical protein